MISIFLPLEISFLQTLLSQSAWCVLEKGPGFVGMGFPCGFGSQPQPPWGGHKHHISHPWTGARQAVCVQGTLFCGQMNGYRHTGVSGSGPTCVDLVSISLEQRPGL